MQTTWQNYTVSREKRELFTPLQMVDKALEEVKELEQALLNLYNAMCLHKSVEKELKEMAEEYADTVITIGDTLFELWPYETIVHFRTKVRFVYDEHLPKLLREKRESRNNG